MKKMRMLSMLLALLLVFSLSLSVLADDAAKITVESWTEAANAGDEVTLAVSIENNPGFLSAAWEIGYDSSKLALQSINTAYNVEIAGKTVEIPYLSGTYASNPKENIVTFMNTTLVKDDSTIFTLTFLVKEGAAGEAAVSVTAKELFAKGGETVAAVSVAGGVTIAESTGGSTAGGSTTGGSTTGGSTTGGSTTGGSTTGGSTTVGSTTGGSTTGGSTTGGSTTGGSTTGGSTTGGSTTGGSTTGGSTTGGSTTGGSTTGGSTTGGSTTGGSTTGGSTTGGSTTGGSTTGGSTTGGSTTGGSTTGGSTTGSDRKVELVGKSNGATYKITGNTLNVRNDVACVVLWTDNGGETYTKLAAIKNEAGGYDFDLTNVPTNAVIKIAIKGDVNGDGRVLASDAIMILRSLQDPSNTGKYLKLNGLETALADVNGDGRVLASDATEILRSLQEPAPGNDKYKALTW